MKVIKNLSSSSLFSRYAAIGDRWYLQRPLSIQKGTKSSLDGFWMQLLTDKEQICFELNDGVEAIGAYSAGQNCIEWKIIPKGMQGFCVDAVELLELNPLRLKPLLCKSCSLKEPPSQAIGEEQIAFSLDDYSILQSPVSSWESFQLAQYAIQYSSVSGFDHLISLSQLRDVELYDYQLAAVKTVLQQMQGRALLCDEVGLGKTVEAGIIFMEFFVRKLVKRVLILTPPSLVLQWKAEMLRKFGIDFIANDELAFKERGQQAWTSFNCIVASYHTAKREPNRSLITSKMWDMVIIDEAHHLRNSKTLLWKFASELQKRYLLLLTATPIQNSLEDLYSLVTLLKPGLLSTEKNFKNRFLNKKDPFQPKNITKLQELIMESMVRNRRSTIGIHFTRRYAKTYRVPLSPQEKCLYDQVSEFVRGQLMESKGLDKLSLLSLQKTMGSSLLSLRYNLERVLLSKQLSSQNQQKIRGFQEAVQEIDGCGKLRKLLHLLQEVPEKIIIFTQFRHTQKLLLEALNSQGESVSVFHGSLTRTQKEEAIQSFAKDCKVLLSTDSGSEGRNLQFCRYICNFDLPWNPMRIEQRIGRVSRIGQKRDVHILNLASAGTIEDRVLYLLEAKVNLFEMVMGEMDMILGNMEKEDEFEDQVIQLWTGSENDSAFAQKIEEFGDGLSAAKERYLEQQQIEDRIFGDSFSTLGKK